MKFSEFQEPFKSEVRAFLKESSNQVWRDVRETKDRILAYLFGLNAGGIVAGVAFLGAHDHSSRLVIVGVSAFVVGLLVAVLRAARDYYACQFSADSLERDVDGLFAGKLDYEQYLANRKVPTAQWFYHTLGIASGVLFFLGLVAGIIGAVRK